MTAFRFTSRHVHSTAKTAQQIRGSRLLGLFLIVLLAGGPSCAGVTASISGTVTDASRAAVVGATVTATNVETGVAISQQTNGQGYYSFQALSLGKYTIAVEQKGSKAYRQTGLVLDVNSTFASRERTAL